VFHSGAVGGACTGMIVFRLAAEPCFNPAAQIHAFRVTFHPSRLCRCFAPEQHVEHGLCGGGRGRGGEVHHFGLFGWRVGGDSGGDSRGDQCGRGLRKGSFFAPGSEGNSNFGLGLAFALGHLRGQVNDIIPGAPRGGSLLGGFREWQLWSTLAFAGRRTHGGGGGGGRSLLHRLDSTSPAPIVNATTPSECRRRCGACRSRNRGKGGDCRPLIQQLLSHWTEDGIWAVDGGVEPDGVRKVVASFVRSPGGMQDLRQGLK
jgi:hypothetical protein